MDRVTEHVYRVYDGTLNLFLIVLPQGLALIDTGFPESLPLLEEGVESMGRRLQDINDILVTHCHPDHAGGLAQLERATGARSWMSASDAELARAGQGFRKYQVSPGPGNREFVRDVIAADSQTYESAIVHEVVHAGQMLPVAEGIRAVGTPGHTAGHLAFLWPQDGGVLFLGDAANNVNGLQMSPIYEDWDQFQASLHKLGDLSFDVACFAHGDPIVGGAAAVFRKTWGGAL